MKVERSGAGLAYWLVAITVVALSGCAGTQAYREGKTLLGEGKVEEGLAKIEEAVRLEPTNAEYRIALATQRASLINGLVAAGEAARREGRLTEAERAYRRAQGFDPDNPMARQGLDALATERRHRAATAEAEAAFKRGGELDLAEASERLRPVLSENPNQKDALNLRARIEDARTKLAKPETRLAAIYRKPVTLEFRDAPLRSVFDVIAKVSGLNFFFDRDVRPDLKATIFAKNTSIEDAVRLLMVTNQLEQSVLNENSILIYPSTPQKLKEYQALTVRSFYLTNADVKSVSNSIKTLVKTKDLVIDERLGIIIMRDTPEAIRMAERIVALQDLSDPEVILEVEVLEIKRSRLLELGVQWPSQLTLSPLVTVGEPLTLADLKNLTTSTTAASIGSMNINARKEDQTGNVLTNPRIRVRNKEKAKVLIGDRVPVITTTSTSTGFVAESVSYIDVGLKLEVEPNIYLDEEVSIKINLEVSNLVREVLSKGGTLVYQIGTRGASTVLRLKDGETQILAGLIGDIDRTTANKVPGLGELPIAGRLFGSQKDEAERTEILLSITPRIVRSIRRPDLRAAEFASGTEANIGAQPLRLAILEPEKKDTKAPAAPTSAVSPRPALAGTSSQPAVTPPVTAVAAVAPPAVVAVVGPAVSLNWQTPGQIKLGEQFSAVLRVNTQGALRGLPLLVGFDPQLLQVVSVQEGDFFKQGGAAISFSQRVDPAQGKVFVATVRQGAAGSDPGINGTGGLVTVTFKAIKAGAARVQLLSASPEPASALASPLPIDQLIKVVP